MDGYLPMPYGAHYDPQLHNYHPSQHHSHGYPHQQHVVNQPNNPHNLPTMDASFRRYHPYSHQEYHHHQFRNQPENVMRNISAQNEQDRAHFDRLLSGLTQNASGQYGGRADGYTQVQADAYGGSNRAHQRVATQVRNVLGWPENHREMHQQQGLSQSFEHPCDGISHQPQMHERSYYQHQHLDPAYVDQCRNEWHASSWMKGDRQNEGIASDTYYNKFHHEQQWEQQKYDHLDFEVRGPTLDSAGNNTSYYQQDLQAPFDWTFAQRNQPVQMLPAPVPSLNAEPNTYLDLEDHPSFKKPPHRSSSLPKGPKKQERRSAAPKDVFDGVELIAEGAAQIPPPPPIEKSAYPLSAIATDLVWRSFLDASNIKGANQSLAPSPMQYSATIKQNDALQSSRRPQEYSSRSSASPQTRMSDKSQASASDASSRSFGAIGRERKPKSSNLSPGSESSSPASSSPGTPSQVSGGPVDLIRTSESHQHLAKFGIGIMEETLETGGPKGNLSYMQPLPRSSSLQHRIYDSSYPAPPPALYDQIRRLISSTLISPQVLLLALYYIKHLPRTSPLFPPATSQSALQSTSVPFKLLLAALVVSNKHLDDNSFRNFTFAQVSRVTLPEVNALEYSMLAGLNFNINVESDDWLAWLQEIQYMRATRFFDGENNIQAILAPIIQGIYAQRYEQNLAHDEQRHPITLSGAPITRREVALKPKLRNTAFEIPLNPFTPRSARTESSWTDSSDLDAAGPLEHRPHYAPLTIGSVLPSLDPRGAFDDILPYYAEPIERYNQFAVAA